MAEKFYIGEKRMEIFKLWLAARVTLFTYRTSDMYWANRVKAVLNSLGNAYLNENSDIFYGVFVDQLIDEIEK